MANKKYFTDESLATFVDETKSYLDSHAGNTTVHITSTERTNWNAAKTHADSAHAPSNAEPNQNAFSNIAVSGQTTVAADAKQDTVTFAGSNVTITTDATNDKVTFTVANGSTSAKGVVQLTNSTSSTSTTTAATPNSVKSAYDLANTAKTNAATAQTKADSAYSLAEGKVDSLSDLGVTATATELNYTDGVTSNIQTQIDGKANYSHNHSANDITTAGYLTIHPEHTSMTLIPFIHNDLAFLDKKGGAVKYYTTTSTDYTVASLTEGSLTINNNANMFDGSSSYATLTANTTYTAVIDLSLHKTFQYSNQFYIDFGSANWRAKNVQVYVMNSTTETAYVKKGGVTGLANGNWLLKFSHTSKNSSGTTVQGFDRLRIVLSDFNNAANRRIAQIGLVNYGSAGVTETFISRGGCSGIHGSLSPNKDGSYDLGTSSKKWKNVYADTLNGTTIPDSPKFTDTTYSNFVKSGSGANAGLVPAPSTTAGTTKYLREDGTWATPPDNNTVYTHPTYTARTGKPTANQTPAFGGTATVSQITSDGTGHVTGATDRTITIPSTLSNGTGTAGLIKTSSTVTSNSGYTACPVISGVPYYKNTTYTALKNPNALTIQGNGTTLTNGTYDGSAAKTVNITPSAIGAFSSSGGTVSGNVYATGYIQSDGNMVCKGVLSATTGVYSKDYIQSDGNMVCGGNMSATGSISSTSHIHATDYIQSDKSIYSKDVVQSDGNMVCGGQFTSKGSMFAESEIFIKNNKCIRGTHAGSTSMTADTSSIIAYINDSDRLIVGSANNTGRTEVRSPGYLVLHTNSGTSISAASAVQFIYDTSYFFRPGKDASTYLGGASYKWKQVYASTATISTSDRNLKKNIKDLDDRYIELFDLIRPVSYQLLSGDRLHTGFIAQEVEEAMEKVGLTAEELGFFCRDIKVVNDTENESDVPVLDEDGNPVYIYSLRYEEYIAIMAEKIRRLEAKYDNKFKQLELELAELKASLN